MRRRLFNALCLLSLLLALAVAALWVRSVWWARDSVRFASGAVSVSVHSNAGCIYLSLELGPWQSRFTYEHGDVVIRGGLEWLPKFIRDIPSVPWWVQLPNWLVCVAFLLPCVYWLWVRRGRPLPGSCTRCGYDLRATTGSSCPECGAARPIAESVAPFPCRRCGYLLAVRGLPCPECGAPSYPESPSG